MPAARWAQIGLACSKRYLKYCQRHGTAFIASYATCAMHFLRAQLHAPTRCSSKCSVQASFASVRLRCWVHGSGMSLCRQAYFFRLPLANSRAILQDLRPIYRQQGSPHQKLPSAPAGLSRLLSANLFPTHVTQEMQITNSVQIHKPCL